MNFGIDMMMMTQMESLSYMADEDSEVLTV